jgi:YD repeat-containing protein
VLCTTYTQYDAAGRLKQVTDPAGNMTFFDYDGLGRKIAMNDADLGPWRYEYDEAGHLTRQIDAKQQEIIMGYDVLGRVTLKDLPPTGPGEKDVISTYDGNIP